MQVVLGRRFDTAARALDLRDMFHDPGVYCDDDTFIVISFSPIHAQFFVNKESKHPCTIKNLYPAFCH